MLKYHIQTIDVPSGGSSAISFNNIPQIYDDLVIVSSTRSSTADVTQYTTFTFNGSTTGYSFRYLFGNGGAGAQVFVSSGNRSDMLGPITNGNNSTANTFGNSQIFIPNYRSAANKSISIDAVMEQNATEAYPQIWSGLWANSSPITSIQIQGNTTFLQDSSISLYGVKRGADGTTNGSAAGGVVTTSGGYTIHTFTSSGTFTTNRDINAEYVIVAGGGGSTELGGGGGAGGYRSSVVGEVSGGGASAEPRLFLPAGTNYLVTVGAGGPGRNNSFNRGDTGSNSEFAGITSIGGGGGGRYDVSGGAGGSGGGAGRRTSPGGTAIAGQGYAGGAGTNYTSDGSGGGGGGAGQVGQSNASGPSNGGNGVSSSISGSAVARAGGGGGGSGFNGTGGTGGSGGGGNGGSGSGQTGANGTANTGGGGGGGGNAGGNGGSGGAGVVIIRYLTPA